MSIRNFYALVLMLSISGCMKATENNMENMNHNTQRLADNVDSVQPEVKEANESIKYIQQDIREAQEQLKAMNEQVKRLADVAERMGELADVVQKFLKAGLLKSEDPAPIGELKNILPEENPPASSPVVTSGPSAPAAPVVPLAPPKPAKNESIKNESVKTETVKSEPTFSDVIKAMPSSLYDSKCVKASSDKVLSVASAYNSYKDLPGHKLEVGGYSLLNLFVSKVELNGEITLAFQPMNSRKSEHYPRFMLKCSVKNFGQNVFMQDCLLDQKTERYGLDNFASRLLVNADSACASGSKVTTWVGWKSNPQHIKEIKEDVSDSTHMPNYLINSFFKEEWFFKQYFTGFYAGWLKAIEN